MKRKTSQYPPAESGSMALREAFVRKEQEGLMINVRAAKDRLSSLLEMAARGDEVVITSDGVPKAKLVPVRQPRRAFQVDWELLRAMPLRRGAPRSEELVRDERDGRP